MAVGDDKTQYFNATGDMQPPAGETWLVKGILLQTDNSAGHIGQVQVTDGTNDFDFMYKNQGHQVWGCYGFTDGSGTRANLASGQFTTTERSQVYIGQYSKDKYAFGIAYSNASSGNGFVIDNTNYLKMTITNNAVITINAVEVASTAGALGASVSETFTATGEMKPPVGETWIIHGVRITAPGASDTVDLDLTDGTIEQDFLYGTNNQDVTWGTFGYYDADTNNAPFFYRYDYNRTFNIDWDAPGSRTYYWRDNDFGDKPSGNGVVIGNSNYLKVVIANSGIVHVNATRISDNS